MRLCKWWRIFNMFEGLGVGILFLVQRRNLQDCFWYLFNPFTKYSKISQ